MWTLWNTVKKSTSHELRLLLHLVSCSYTCKNFMAISLTPSRKFLFVFSCGKLKFWNKCAFQILYRITITKLFLFKKMSKVRHIDTDIILKTNLKESYLNLSKIIINLTRFYQIHQLNTLYITCFLFQTTIRAMHQTVRNINRN